MTTRDSKGWPVLMVAAVLGAVATQPQLIEGLLELNKKAIAAIVCIVLAAIAGQMGTSPLPGEHDDMRMK